MQRSLNVTLDTVMDIHSAAIVFMEAAKRVFPKRNGSLNKKGDPVGWNIPKFYSILHKAMDLLLYGWSENVSTQGAECAHKV